MKYIIAVLLLLVVLAECNINVQINVNKHIPHNKHLHKLHNQLHRKPNHNNEHSIVAPIESSEGSLDEATSTTPKAPVAPKTSPSAPVNELKYGIWSDGKVEARRQTPGPPTLSYFKAIIDGTTPAKTSYEEVYMGRKAVYRYSISGPGEGPSIYKDEFTVWYSNPYKKISIYFSCAMGDNAQVMIQSNPYFPAKPVNEWIFPAANSPQVQKQNPHLLTLPPKTAIPKNIHKPAYKVTIGSGPNVDGQAFREPRFFGLTCIAPIGSATSFTEITIAPMV